ncbi:G5 domain-containing protein [Polaromonas sp.]|nr:G5 domain-containing protein [Candidatus Saccharibacteria bacterium]
MTKNSLRALKTDLSQRARRQRFFQFVHKHPLAVPVITFFALSVITAGGYSAQRLIHKQAAPLDARIVIISHDRQKQVVPSRERTVGGLLKKLDITLNEGDVVEPAVTATINQDDFRVNIYRAVPVQIRDGSKVSYTFSAATTARSIAKQANTAVYPEDIIATQPVQDFTKTGAIGKEVTIDRSVAVNLNLYGTAVALRTHADTVGELMKQKNIVVAKGDQVTPAPTTPLTPNTQVYISRNGTKIELVTEDIAMPVQTISDPTLAYGTSAIRQAGSPGKQIITYQYTLRNDKVVGRTVIQTVVTQQPVTQIVVSGSSLSGIKGDMQLAGIAPGDYQYVDYIISHESGWCPTKAQGQYGGCPPYAGSVPSTGGYGLCQSTPGSKMASAGADWATNPVTQLRWCSGYAMGRYGSWAAAYNYWLSHHNW